MVAVVLVVTAANDSNSVVSGCVDERDLDIGGNGDGGGVVKEKLR